MEDDIELMPGNWIVDIGEIRKFRNCQDFIVMDSNGKYHTIKYSTDIKNAYNYYFEIWDNCKEFGLPNNGDWTKNPVWLVDFVKMFNRIYLEIENYRIEKRRK